MKTVWILFSVANDYNQPEKAFERLFWEPPTPESVGKIIGTKPEALVGLCNGEHYNEGTDYWIETFTDSQPESK